jgi:hypothetical protein
MRTDCLRFLEAERVADLAKAEVGFRDKGAELSPAELSEFAMVFCLVSQVADEIEASLSLSPKAGDAVIALLPQLVQVYLLGELQAEGKGALKSPKTSER